MSEQYQGQPAEGFKPLEEWGEGQAFSSEEVEAWKRSPVTRLESRVIATIADLLAENARLQNELMALSRRVHYRDEHPWDFEDCMRADCSEARAALAATLDGEKVDLGAGDQYDDED